MQGAAHGQMAEGLNTGSGFSPFVLPAFSADAGRYLIRSKVICGPARFISKALRKLLPSST